MALYEILELNTNCSKGEQSARHIQNKVRPADRAKRDIYRTK